jgi:hypothetical protein
MYNINLIGTGFYIESTTAPETPRFFGCGGTRLGIDQDQNLKIYPNREEQDFYLSFAEIAHIKDLNGNFVICNNIKEVFIFLCGNLCKGENNPTTTAMQIPTPEIILNNFNGLDSSGSPKILKVFFRETKNTDFLNKNPKIIFERYKKRKKSSKNFDYRDQKKYVYTKKGFVKPQDGQLDPNTGVQIKNGWNCPTQANEYLEIDIQSTFIDTFTKNFYFPKGQGTLNKPPNRKPPRFQYFRFRIEITENNKKYYSEPSQIFSIGGNWANNQRNENERVLQIFFK